MAGVYLPADIYARYNRLRGREVLFVCGTDENAATTILEARRRSVAPRQLADEYHRFQREVFGKLGISFDIFSRTSKKVHHDTVWRFYEELERRDLVYSAQIVQPFCENCQQHLPDRFIKGICPKCGAEDQYGDSCEVCAQWFDAVELVDPSCTICGGTPTERRLQHSFLRLSSLTDAVLAYVEEVGIHWRKRTFRKTLSWIKEEGLKDRDITRDYDWGPRAPFLNSGQVIYNWAENLLGYISATRDWSADETQGGSRSSDDYWRDPSAKIVCFVGKDNLFFHTILFPALLLGHGSYCLPRQVVVNEFVNFEGSKMSTSRGHVVALHELLERLDPETIRYYAAAIAPENRDAAFSLQDMVRRANGDLADSVGNLVNRVLVLCAKLGARITPASTTELDEGQRRLLERIGEATQYVEGCLERFEFKKALERAIDLSRTGNRFLNEARPWERPDEAVGTIWVLLLLLRNLSVLLFPFLPTLSERIWEVLGHEGSIQERGWDDALSADPQTPSAKRAVLFRKIPPLAS